MNAAADIALIAEQERALVFPSLDEGVAFALGAAMHAHAVAHGLPVIIDIQTWDRPLFYAALPGSTVHNRDWARRKRNVVRTFLKSSYRVTLEQQSPDRTFQAAAALDPADFVLAGGGFPLSVRGAGVIGAVAVSGLPEREDHNLVAGALARHLGLDAGGFALP